MGPIDDDDTFDAMTELSEIREVSVPSLSVVVDFNDLMDRLDEPEIWRVLSALKDLLS